MKALFSLISSVSMTTLWAKLKVGLLVSAISFMVWQGWQMNALQHDVTKLETIQTGLQLQVQQISADYTMLRDNYKNSAKTSLQYFESVNQLNGKSTELEKSFSALELKAANASQKADTALSLSKGTATRASNETSSTTARKSLGRDSNDGASGSDAEWRELLDKTYCSVYPTDNKCT
jgi:chromosome segregation ATPase